ncbi:MAG: hypothetical protein DWQ37_05490 [Planctomycetota bacterium]|nr:MAG: hypothetical protein DWQ37_05490 [Planctomycetota bacterium]
MERNIPRRPEPPGQAKPNRSSMLPVALVVVPLAMLVGVVVAFTGRAGLLMLAVVACVPAFIMLHYVLWGHWLSKSLRREDAEDADRQ